MALRVRLLVVIASAGAVAAAVLSPGAPITHFPAIGQAIGRPAGGSATDVALAAGAGSIARQAGWDTSGSTGTVSNSASGRMELQYPDPSAIALVIGDSQADGAAGVPGTATWPRLALESAGYVPLFRGRGGTGFTAAGDAAANYVDALRTQQWLVPHGPVGLVVIQGGGNDARVGASDTQISEAARDLVDELRRSYPDSPMLMVGTLARSGNEGGGRRHEVDAVLSRAAAQAGISFVSAGDWLSTLGLGAHMADGVHLNAAGHRIAAGALLAELERRGLVRDATILAGAPEQPRG